MSATSVGMTPCGEYSRVKALCGWLGQWCVC